MIFPITLFVGANGGAVGGLPQGLRTIGTVDPSINFTLFLRGRIASTHLSMNAALSTTSAASVSQNDKVGFDNEVSKSGQLGR